MSGRGEGERAGLEWGLDDKGLGDCGQGLN